MAKFPSKAWFDAVRKIYNADDSYRGAGGGQCNCLMGLKMGADNFLITFEGGTKVEAEIEYTIPVPVLGKMAEKLVLKRNEREVDMWMENLKERLEV